MQLLVSVTKEDIKYGKPGSSYDCPVALATRRALQISVTGYSSVAVGATVMTLSAAGDSKLLDNPARVHSFVRALDVGCKVRNPSPLQRLRRWWYVRPFTFTLEV